MTDTSSTSGARAHARAQAGAVVEAMATVPAQAAVAPPLEVPPEMLVWVETVPGGGYTTKRIARGTRLRLSDTRGDACVHLVVYNAIQPFERLCVADTVKVMWNAYLTPGHLLLSDQARVLCSVSADSSAHHDTMAGPSTRMRNEQRYGQGAPESTSPAGRELLVLAAAKQGLDPRDIPASISFFKGIRVDTNGALIYTGSAAPGSYVEVLAEMDLVVLIANSAHPLDPREAYTCTPVSVAAWQSEPTVETDALFHATPEGERAFWNTAEYLAAQGIR